MQPEYQHGEILVFSRAAPIRSGDDCFVVFFHPVWGLCERFKRVYLRSNGDVFLRSLNWRYGFLVLERVRLLAMVRAVARADVAGAPKVSGPAGSARPSRGTEGIPRGPEASPAAVAKATAEGPVHHPKT
jgi:hypothetical protein